MKQRHNKLRFPPAPDDLSPAERQLEGINGDLRLPEIAGTAQPTCMTHSENHRGMTDPGHPDPSEGPAAGAVAPERALGTWH